jgi:hypothetical protein
LTNFLASVALRSITIAILISLSTQLASGFFLFERKLAVSFLLKTSGPFLLVYGGKVIDSSRNARAAELFSSVTQELRSTSKCASSNCFAIALKLRFN